MHSRIYTIILLLALSWGPMDAYSQNGAYLKPNEKDGKWGFVDKDGKTVIPYNYDDAFEFSEGLAQVKINGKWGYINQNGKTIIPFRYDKTWPFRKGTAVVRKIVQVHSLSDTLQIWSDMGNGTLETDRFGLINKKGELIHGFIFENVLWQPDNFSIVMQNGKYAFMDGNGRILTGWFDNADFFYNGLAAVALDGQWGFINEKGHLAIPLQYDEIYFGFENGKAYVRKGNDVFFIDKSGQCIENCPKQ